MFPSRDEPEQLYFLPPLNKKVIYLDQFAISEMMKLLNPNTDAYQENKIDPFWKLLFEKIERLCKLQLIVCPDSYYHEDESLVTPFYKELKRIYELFSHGITFSDSMDIKIAQFLNHAEKWIKGDDFNKIDLDASDVVSDDINSWQSRLIITLETDYKVDWIENIKRARESTHEIMKNLFDEWTLIENFSFQSFYEKESKSYGGKIFHDFLDNIKLYAQNDSSLIPKIINNPFTSILFRGFENIFKNNNVSEKDLLPRIIEYLNSDIFDSIPYVKIYCLLITALARKAKSGQKKPPNRGTVNDISIVSYILPYCDAIFIDNGCEALLYENPIPSMISEYNTQIFSQNKKDKFLEYLDEIEKSMSVTHYNYVKSVYGEEFLKPYLTIFTHN
ncbi:MAG: hypothetical protein NTX65_12430 [Ignavibacteriales bacterium]|nr:hypothetical protein [Ignavibacteriales bacterium]